jgi:hypothetical protein
MAECVRRRILRNRQVPTVAVSKLLIVSTGSPARTKATLGCTLRQFARGGPSRRSLYKSNSPQSIDVGTFDFAKIVASISAGR